ncbi:MAG: hypothetical protein ACI87W_002999 [Halieaceae bacterium]|jgi:hypothetical protein
MRMRPYVRKTQPLEAVLPWLYLKGVSTGETGASLEVQVGPEAKRSKGCLTRDGMLHMMFNLGMCAQETWRRLRGFNYLSQVITGVKFKGGIEVKVVD